MLYKTYSFLLYSWCCIPFLYCIGQSKENTLKICFITRLNYLCAQLMLWLEALGVPLGIYPLYESMSGKVQLVVRGCASTFGVKQGCPLLPTLFALYRWGITLLGEIREFGRMYRVNSHWSITVCWWYCVDVWLSGFTTKTPNSHYVWTKVCWLI